MATLAELIADVYTVTNRPDLVAETSLAVKKATLKAHHSDFYSKDLFETAIEWSPVGYLQSFEYRSVIPRWRAFKYLRKYDAATATPSTFFTALTADQTVDGYGINKEDICYVAGEMLEIRSSTQDSHMLLGCYLHPNLSTEAFTSWIAVDHPYLIVYEAAATIFNSVGMVEECNNLRRTEVAEQFRLLKQELAVSGE